MSSTPIFGASYYRVIAGEDRGSKVDVNIETAQDQANAEAVR